MDVTPHRLIAAAEEYLQAKLGQRSKKPLVNSIDADVRLHARLETEAKAFGSIIGIDPDHFRPDDRLGEILRVDRGDLPADVQSLLSRFGLRDHIIVGGARLLEHVESRTRSDRAILNQPPFVPTPRSEDEWMDRIMGMTIQQFLVVLS